MRAERHARPLHVGTAVSSCSETTLRPEPLAHSAAPEHLLRLRNQPRILHYIMYSMSSIPKKRFPINWVLQPGCIGFSSECTICTLRTPELWKRLAVCVDAPAYLYERCAGVRRRWTRMDTCMFHLNCMCALRGC